MSIDQGTTSGWQRRTAEVLDGAFDSTSSAVKVTQATLLAGEDLTNNVQATTNKPVVSSTYSGLPFMAVSDADISVKASAGNLLSVVATNANATVRYLQLHNKATAPAAAEVPIISVPIPAGTATVPGRTELGRDFFGANGHHLATGIAIGISTTAGTFTAATAADHVASGTYV